MEDEHIRIRFERDGGFSGRGLTADIDSAALPAADAATLRDLVARARVFEQPAPAARRGVRDGFRFRLTVAAGTRRAALETSDGAMPEALAPLVEFLTAMAKRSAQPQQRPAANNSPGTKGER